MVKKNDALAKAKLKKKLMKKLLKRVYYDSKKGMRYVIDSKNRRVYIASDKSNQQIVRVIVNNLVKTKRAPKTNKSPSNNNNKQLKELIEFLKNHQPVERTIIQPQQPSTTPQIIIHQQQPQAQNVQPIQAPNVQPVQAPNIQQQQYQQYPAYQSQPSMMSSYMQSQPSIFSSFMQPSMMSQQMPQTQSFMMPQAQSQPAMYTDTTSSIDQNQQDQTVTIPQDQTFKIPTDFIIPTEKPTVKKLSKEKLDELQSIYKQQTFKPTEKPVVTNANEAFFKQGKEELRNHLKITHALMDEIGKSDPMADNTKSLLTNLEEREFEYETLLSSLLDKFPDKADREAKVDILISEDIPVTVPIDLEERREHIKKEREKMTDKIKTLQEKRLAEIKQKNREKEKQSIVEELSKIQSIDVEDDSQIKKQIFAGIKPAKASITEEVSEEELAQPIERGEPEQLIKVKDEEDEGDDEEVNVEKSDKSARKPKSILPKQRGELVKFILDYIKDPEKKPNTWVFSTIKSELERLGLKPYLRYNVKPYTLEQYKEMHPNTRRQLMNELLNRSLTLYIIGKPSTITPISPSGTITPINPSKELLDIQTQRDLILKASKVRRPKKESEAEINELASLGYGKESKEESEGGLTAEEIERMMSHYKEFKGCYHEDDVRKIHVSHTSKPFAICILIPWGHGGSHGHWVSLYVDPKNKMIEYYNPFGEAPPNQLSKEFKRIVNELDSTHLFQYKINKVKNQRANSDTCGYHAMKFIIDRINGKHFKEASGYSTIMKSENEIKQLKKHVQKFGYL